MEREADKALIDDETVIQEEYQPINSVLEEEDNYSYHQAEMAPVEISTTKRSDVISNSNRKSNNNNSDDDLSSDEDSIASECEEDIAYSPSALAKAENILLSDKDGVVNEDERTLNLHTGVNLSGIAITLKLIKSLKAKMEKGIDQSLKPEGECSYFSLMGGA